MAFWWKVSDFVNWLVDLKFVSHTGETQKNKPKYEVTSRRMELVKFYCRHRDMNKKIVQSFSIAANRTSTINLIGKNGGILCLTTTLELHGDEYFRDPTVHAYLDDPNLISILKDQVEGNTKIILYTYDLLDELIVKKKNIPITFDNRTIVDLFCANLAYAAKRFIPKVWSK